MHAASHGAQQPARGGAERGSYCRVEHTAGERLSRVLIGTWIVNIGTETLSETTRVAAARVRAAAWRPGIATMQQAAKAAVCLEIAWRLIEQRRKLALSHHLHGHSVRERRRRDWLLGGEGRERGRRACRGRSARRRQLRLSR
jgi:hypothetical protein